MLATRIIPTLLYRGDTLVKGQQFNAWRSVGHVQQAARIHALRGVDELCILDIGATPEGREPDFGLVERLTDGNFCPIAVGGGARRIGDIQRLLRAGADKVVIGTAGYNDCVLLANITAKVGSQAIVLAIDYRAGRIVTNCGSTTHDTVPGKGIVDQAVAAEMLGVGEILLTSIDREGMMQGYDLATIKAVAGAVNIPVIAHGGAGNYQHMLEAIQAGASAVAAGAMFQFTWQTPRGAAEYLHGKGIEVRL